METVTDTVNADKGTHDHEVDQLMDSLEQPHSFFLRQRGEEELNLVVRVRECMVNAGLGDRLADSFDSHRLIQEVENKGSHAQQFNLTRYFAHQLMIPSDDTSVERYSLMYEVRPDRWLEIFEKTVLPTIGALGLPKKL